MNSMLSKLAHCKQAVDGLTDDNSKSESPKEEKISTNTSFWYHEFKILGQIGELSQTDKLTFVSLTHQIYSGLKRQYKDAKIVDVVIQAISLHSSLRSYVEILKDASA